MRKSRDQVPKVNKNQSRFRTRFIFLFLSKWVRLEEDHVFEQMKKQKMTYTVYDVPIPCNVIWENIRTYKSGYSHDNKCEGYDYKGRQITFEVLDDILKEFNKQKESTHYTSNIYGVTKANYHEGVYYIQGNKSSALGDTKTLHFGCYNSYTIDDVFDGNFYVRISFRVTKEI